jgi:hypothetical protein
MMRRKLAGLLAALLLLPAAPALAQLHNPTPAPILLGEREGLLRPAPQPATTDADATAWAAQVVTNGGTVSATQLDRVNRLIGALKSGTAPWTRTDDYLLLVTENTAQALTSLKQRRLATAVNSPSFVVGGGYVFNGTTNYIDSGFNPSINAVVMTVNDVRIAAYVMTDVTAGAGNSGATSVVASRSLSIRPRSGVNFVFAANTNFPGAAFALPAASPIGTGYAAGARFSANTTDVYAYKNGAALALVTAPTAVGTPLPSHTIFIGADNRAGVPQNFNPNTMGLIEVGASMTAGQELDAFVAFNVYMASWGSTF